MPATSLKLLWTFMSAAIFLLFGACSQIDYSSDPGTTSSQDRGSEVQGIQRGARTFGTRDIVEPVYRDGVFYVEGDLPEILSDLRDYEGTEAVLGKFSAPHIFLDVSDFDLLSELVELLANLDRVTISGVCLAPCSDYAFMALDNVYVESEAIIAFSGSRALNTLLIEADGSLSAEAFEEFVLPLSQAEQNFFADYDISESMIADAGLQKGILCRNPVRYLEPAIGKAKL